ncbi:hypothetical protein [Streptomyces sp. NPDC058385]
MIGFYRGGARTRPEEVVLGIGTVSKSVPPSRTWENIAVFDCPGRG